MATILVGNGPSILDKKQGTKIDQFDVVVRFNTFYIEGFEEYTGTKIDVWAVNIGYIAFPNDGGIQWLLPNVPIPKTIVFAPYTLEKFPNYNKIKVMPFPPNTYLCSEKIARDADVLFTGKTWISCGLMAVMEYAPCTIVGFDCFSGRRHHIVDDGKGSQWHDSERERKFIDEMIAKKLVTHL